MSQALRHPVHFQTIVLEWDQGGEHESAMLDWSDGCQGPGRSIFPRQAWSFSFDLKSTARSKSLEHLTLGLLGQPKLVCHRGLCPPGHMSIFLDTRSIKHL